MLLVRIYRLIMHVHPSELQSACCHNHFCCQKPRPNKTYLVIDVCIVIFLACVFTFYALFLEATNSPVSSYTNTRLFRLRRFLAFFHSLFAFFFSPFPRFLLHFSSYIHTYFDTSIFFPLYLFSSSRHLSLPLSLSHTHTSQWCLMIKLMIKKWLYNKVNTKHSSIRFLFILIWVFSSVIFLFFGTKTNKS